MSHSEWPVIPPVLNRRGEIKNKAVLKTTKTSVGQPHQGRGDIKHTQIQPNRWFVSTITLAHISCMLRHTRIHISGPWPGVSWCRSTPLAGKTKGVIKVLMKSDRISVVRSSCYVPAKSTCCAMFLEHMQNQDIFIPSSTYCVVWSCAICVVSTPERSTLSVTSLTSKVELTLLNFGNIGDA